jgi:hypothetical protein
MGQIHMTGCSLDYRLTAADQLGDDSNSPFEDGGRGQSVGRTRSQLYCKKTGAADYRRLATKGYQPMLSLYVDPTPRCKDCQYVRTLPWGDIHSDSGLCEQRSNLPEFVIYHAAVHIQGTG